MDNSILVALNDSVSSRVMIDFIADLPIRRDRFHITLLHVYRTPSAGQELMGERFMTEQPTRFLSVLTKAKEKLVEKGFAPEKIETRLAEDPYQTVTDGLIDQFNKGRYSMVVIGRKTMSNLL